MLASMRRATSETRRRIRIVIHPSRVRKDTFFRERETQPEVSSLSSLLSIQRRSFSSQSSSSTDNTNEGTNRQEEDSSQFNTAPIRGMHDIFPEQSFIRRHILRKAEQVAETYGYGEIQTPIVERTQLFERSLGGDTDVVSKEMYTFQDRSENQLSLRPENTAGVVRSFLSIPKSRQRESLPCKYFYYGPMFRYERPQKGRYRQFHQIGFEHFSLIGGGGDPSPPSSFISSNSLHSDTDSICSAVRFLHELKLLNHTTLTVNTLGDEESRNIYRDVLRSYFEEHRSQLSPLSQARLDRGSVLRILDSKEKIDTLLIQEAPSLRSSLTPPSRHRFDLLCETLSNLHINFQINSKLDLTFILVRGLDYYQHLVFEFVDNENLTTVLAGGRYDSLLTQLGGDGMKEIGAIGWAAGVERLELMLKATPPIHSQKPLVPIIVVRSDSDSEISSTSTSSSSFSLSEMERLEVFALNILERLRKSGGSAVGVSAETYHDRTTGKQLARALKKGSKAAVIVGVEEMRKGKVQIKHFDSRKQVECSLDEIERTLQGLLNISFE